MTQLPLQRAETLDRFYQTLEIRPLLLPAELAAFYSAELNKAREKDVVPRLVQALRRAHGGRFFQAFLAGHSGCGKTTELSRLSHQVSDQYRVIRFSAKDELDPSAAEPFDVLILMMIRLAEEASKPDTEGGLAWTPPPELSRRVLDWFATETTRVTSVTSKDTSAEAGAGLDKDSLVAKVAGLFGRIRGEIRFAAERKKEVVEYRFARVTQLIDLLNAFFDACNEHLQFRRKQDWLFLGEDFEKLFNEELPEIFFSRNSALFSSLRTHLIFTIPVHLAWSVRNVTLPFPVHAIPDTPVYTITHAPDEGREALRELLARRINADLFAPGQLDRLIVASGGRLRDLFDLVKEAADLALLAGAHVIRSEDASLAIAKLRREALLRLGESPYDPEPIPYEDLAKRMVAIYKREPNADLPDAILRALLRTRAVQEFNGEGRFAVTPVVVDILVKQGRLEPDSPGGLLPETGAPA